MVSRVNGGSLQLGIRRVEPGSRACRNGDRIQVSRRIVRVGASALEPCTCQVLPFAFL